MTTTTIALTDPVNSNLGFYANNFYKSNVNILVLGYDYLGDSYIFSGDGLTKTSALIYAHGVYNVEDSAFAVVRGEMIIFGGFQEPQQVTLSKN